MRLLLDSWLTDDWSKISGDPAKLMPLGVGPGKGVPGGASLTFKEGFGAMWLWPLSLVPCWGTDAPIIGILSVPAGAGCETANGGSCFASLYTKYVEAAGGRVVPLLYDWSPEQLERSWRQVNGVLFTGGGVDLGGGSPSARQYLRAAGLLFNLTKSVDDVPLWGTCMGLQTLAVLAAPGVLETNAYDSEDLSLPLEFTEAAQSSRLFGAMPEKLKHWLSSENLTSNLHHDGVPPRAFQGQLSKTYRMLASNRDRRGRAFASVIEGTRWPIYGVQFHPERPIFSWIQGEGINHSAHAIEAMQYFANFFVSEARGNAHHFESKDHLSVAFRV